MKLHNIFFWLQQKFHEISEFKIALDGSITKYKPDEIFCFYLLGGKGEKLIGHELFRKFDDYIDEEDVETYFKRHLNPTDYQNLLKKFETVKRVNLEIFDPSMYLYMVF